MFITDIAKVLPYDRSEYLNNLDSDYDFIKSWYGASFQLHNEISTSKAFVESYKTLFNNVALSFGTNTSWVVNHVKGNMKWFPSDKNNLPLLRSLFKENKVPNTFRGALILSADELLIYRNDLLEYPFKVARDGRYLYSDVDISNREKPFIIKISGHMNIDFLSPDYDLLLSIVNQNKSAIFNIKPYRGTQL